MLAPGCPMNLTCSEQPFEAPSKKPLGVRMLIADDDPRVRRALATSMSQAGFHVISADDGGTALVAAEQTPPDLALVDFDMPTPGIEVVRELKRRYGPSIWIAVLSGMDDAVTRRACFDAGADDVIAKPTQLPEIRMRMFAAARTQQAFVEVRLARERADRLIAYGAEASAMLAHDLNNGLTVALGNVSYLLDLLQEGELDKATFTATAAATNSALRRMSGLVANFVDIARFEDAAVKPRRIKTDVRALIGSVIDVHAMEGDDRFEIDCDPGLVGHFDPELIERVLHNLVGNATRYCKPGGIIRISGHAWDSLDGSGIELGVYNSGPPVPEALRDHLFKKYARGSNGKRGLGLYFSRLTCEAHGGSIELLTPPSGTAFRVRLPNRE